MASANITIEITLRLVAAEMLVRQARLERIAFSMAAWHRDTTPGELARLMLASLFVRAHHEVSDIEEEIRAVGTLLVQLQQPANDEGGHTPHAA